MTTIGNEWEIIQRNVQFKLPWWWWWWWWWWRWWERTGTAAERCIHDMNLLEQIPVIADRISGVRLLSQLSSFAPHLSQTSLVRGAVFRLRLGPAGPLGPHTCSWTASSWELQRLMSRWLPVSRESRAQVQRPRLRAQNWRTMRTRSCDCHYSSSRKHLDNHINYQYH